MHLTCGIFISKMWIPLVEVAYEYKICIQKINCLISFAEKKICNMYIKKNQVVAYFISVLFGAGTHLSARNCCQLLLRNVFGLRIHLEDTPKRLTLANWQLLPMKTNKIRCTAATINRSCSDAKVMNMFSDETLCIRHYRDSGTWKVNSNPKIYRFEKHDSCKANETFDMHVAGSLEQLIQLKMLMPAIPA